MERLPQKTLWCGKEVVSAACAVQHSGSMAAFLWMPWNLSWPMDHMWEA